MQLLFYPRPVAFFLLASAFLAAAPTSVAAQEVAAQKVAPESIERILVTASLRQGTTTELPASVAVLGAGKLFDRQAQHLDEVLNAVANVNFSSGASRGRFVQIRGIGERSQFAEPINPSVGLVVDDMDFSGIAGLATLFDVEQVEVLRGPQGTSFGASAMAGVIKLKTVDPSATANSHLKLSVGQHNTWEVAAAHGDALSEQWQYRIALQQYQSDGMVDNIYLHRDDTDNLDELSSRFKLRYLPSADLTVDLSWQHFNIDNGYDAFSLDNDNRTRSDEPGFDRQQTTAFGVNASWQHDWGLSKLILAHNSSDLAYGYDEDWTFVGFHPWAYSSQDHYFRERDNSSADIRLLSGDDTRIWSGSTAWAVGVYLRRTSEDLLRQYTFNDGDFSSAYEVDTAALYAQLDTQLNRQFSLIKGLRIERTQLAYRDNADFVEDNSDTLIGGKVALQYQGQFGVLYTSVSRGYKLGGFNPDQRIVASRRVFQPEYNWNFEMGSKNRYLDDALSLHFNLFYMTRNNTQVSDFTTVAIGDTGATSFVDIIANADLGVNKGIEIAVDYQASADLRAFATIGLLDAYFESYINAKGELIPAQEQAQAPAYTFNLGMDFNLTQSLRFTLELDGKDDYRFSDGHDERANSAVLVHGNVSYQMHNVTLSLWGKNIFDKRYYVRGFGGFSNDPREFYEQAEPYYQFGAGRQIGLAAQFDF